MIPIGTVRASRTTPEDDFWGGSLSVIELAEGFEEESLAGLEAFSHVEVLYVFHLVTADKIVTSARHPRNNPAWPRIGIFAQRGKNRPNRLGATVCRVRGVEGRRLLLAGLDAIDGTPVVDIKPWLRELGPRGEVHQPAWVDALMAGYWS